MQGGGKWAHQIFGAPSLEVTDPEPTGVRNSPASRIDGRGSAELSRAKFLEDQLPAEGVKIISLPTSVVVSSHGHNCKETVGETQVVGGFRRRDGNVTSDVAAIQWLSAPVVCFTKKLSVLKLVTASLSRKTEVDKRGEKTCEQVD
jgi:hypothetical protein